MSTACAWWPIMPDTKSTSAFVYGIIPLSAAACSAGERGALETVDPSPVLVLALAAPPQPVMPTIAASNASTAAGRSRCGRRVFIPTPLVESRYSHTLLTRNLLAPVLGAEASVGEPWLVVRLEECDDIARRTVRVNPNPSGREVEEHLDPRKLLRGSRASIALHVGLDDTGLVAQDRRVARRAGSWSSRVPLARERHACEAERRLAAAVRGEAGEASRGGTRRHVDDAERSVSRQRTHHETHEPKRRDDVHRIDAGHLPRVEVRERHEALRRGGVVHEADSVRRRAA